MLVLEAEVDLGQILYFDLSRTTKGDLVSFTSCWLGIIMFSRPGKSQGLLYKHLCDYYLTNPLVKKSLRHCHVLMVGDGASSHKID